MKKALADISIAIPASANYHIFILPLVILIIDWCSDI